MGQAPRSAEWPEAERKATRVRYFSLKLSDVGGVVDEHHVDTITFKYMRNHHHNHC